MASYFSTESDPEFLNVLSPLDKEQYQNLRHEFYSNLNASNVVKSFNNVLSAIKDYSVRNNEDDGKRCNCCGVCWLPNKLGVNTNKLSYLTGQQKNNINSALMSLKYIPTTFTDELYQKIPELQGNIVETRMWTIRKLNISTPTPSLRITAISHQQTVQTFSSPSANVYYSTLSHQWSYEDYALHDDGQDGEDDSNFFEDSFSIPLDAWQDDEEDGDY